MYIYIYIYGIPCVYMIICIYIYIYIYIGARRLSLQGGREHQPVAVCAAEGDLDILSRIRYVQCSLSYLRSI